MNTSPCEHLGAVGPGNDHGGATYRIGIHQEDAPPPAISIADPAANENA